MSAAGDLKHTWKGSRALRIMGLAGLLFWMLMVMHAHVCQSEMLICWDIVFLN